AERVLADFTVPSEPGNEREVMDRVATAVAPIGLPPDRVEKLKTAVAEAAMNAIEHGNQGNAELRVVVRVVATPEDVSVLITDQGGAPSDVTTEEPDIEAKLAGLQKPRGWGLFLIRNMVDELDVTTDGHLHTVRLTLRLEEEETRANA
ncbi:MAG: ATP-binding protein, partial [Frankia sp.]|nr:ATP-binding protein [Frankia sp.]